MEHMSHMDMTIVVSAKCSNACYMYSEPTIPLSMCNIFFPYYSSVRSSCTEIFVNESHPLGSVQASA